MSIKPQIEKIISPIVHRCVVEEYEFRRDNWQNIKPFSSSRNLTERAKVIKRQFGVTVLSLIFLLVALFVTWSKYSGLQIAYLTVQSPDVPEQREPSSK